MRPNLRLLAALVLAVSATPPGARADWSNFYAPSRDSSSTAGGVPARGVSAAGLCVREILKAQLRHAIPGNLLLGIGLQEAGMTHEGEVTIWPWVANADGDGRFFDHRDSATNWIRAQQSAGTDSIDVGCLQVNLRWHPDAFNSLEEALDPATNVDYAARYLAALYAQTGDWVEAAGRYHSSTTDLKNAYTDRLRGNVTIANGRLAHFRDLAARGGPRDVRQVAAHPAPSFRAEGHFWTSHLTRGSGADADGARSLFGRETLQPVLPAFRKMF